MATNNVSVLVREATSQDYETLLDIYGLAVRDTVITWEYDIPSLQEFTGRFETIKAKGFPILVIENQGIVQGYAYASPYRDRFGYRFCCESTIYLKESCHGLGFGRQLYTALLEVLREQGFVAVIAGIASPNAQSENFHLKMGFQFVGIHKEIGFKFGEWRSVAFYQRELAAREAPTQESPTSFQDLELVQRPGANVNHWQIARENPS